MIKALSNLYKTTLYIVYYRLHCTGYFYVDFFFGQYEWSLISNCYAASQVIISQAIEQKCN